MTDGKIQVEYFAAKERVGAFDSFDEVASGNAQAYHAADYYWKGKHPGWAYFTAVPFGLSYTEMNAWIRFGGGQELWGRTGSKNLASNASWPVTPGVRWVVGSTKKSTQQTTLRA